MRLGVDLDNTIVCHDPAFRRVAAEQGWADADGAIGKGGLRDRLRAAGREDAWTRTQGYVYGPGMRDAPPYPGVCDFFRRAAGAGIEVWIVSHRTRWPYLGPEYDLHQAALDWLESNGFFTAGLDRGRVFLELSKEEKLRRIRSLGCTHFIDDLPELLGEQGFPPETERLLFDPDDRHGATTFRRLRSWNQLAEEVLAA